MSKSKTMTSSNVRKLQKALAKAPYQFIRTIMREKKLGLKDAYEVAKKEYWLKYRFNLSDLLNSKPLKR